MIAENTTHHIGMNGVADVGRTMKMRWLEIVEPKPEETRTAAEIKKKIIDKMKEGDLDERI